MSEETTKQITHFKQELIEQTVLITQQDAAKILDCSVPHVTALIRNGCLHAYCRNKGSRGVRLLASELMEYVRSLKIDKENWND